MDEEVLSQVGADTKFNLETVSSSGQGFEDGSALSGNNRRLSNERCKVCGDEATGMYFGAIVCVPCKVRYCGKIN